ncbi:MAG: sugar transferase [Planctomycetes bacterium]|nr:sugar transferase [Planctomycetota bacterium]
MTSVASKSPGGLWGLADLIASVFRQRCGRRILLAGANDVLEDVRETLAKTAAGTPEISVFSSEVFGDGNRGLSADVQRLAQEALRSGAREVVLFCPDASAREILAATRTLMDQGLCVHVLANRLCGVAGHLYSHNGHLAGYPYVQFGKSRRAAGEMLKRAMDITISSLALVALLPVWALLIPVLLVVQGSPVLLRQRRVGRAGRKFLMYKFRTMSKQSEWPPEDQLEALNTRNGPMFKAPDDPRVTRLGKWLRRFCIDETPQIINVLAGDMSLVGARPPLPEEVDRYRQWHHERLCGHVGITGFWQISNRSALDFGDVVLLDFYYNTRGGLLLDLKILAATLTAVLSGRVVS